MPALQSKELPSLLARHRQLAPTASVRVSPLCLGAMTFGDKMAERYGQVSQADAFGIMDAFYAAGGNFIDTANGYQHGQSEEWVGAWMKERGVRDEIVLATKYTSPFMGAHPDKIQSNFVGTGAKSMRVSVETSLKRLQTEYIDLLYVHWWDYTTSVPELMHALDRLVKSGKVIYLGISDTPAWIVSKANEYARQKGLTPFSVYQGMWNASLRDFERDIIPMTRDEGMALAPYGVLNQGRFQTKAAFIEREKKNDGRNAIPTSEHDKRVSAVLESIAVNKGCNLLHVAVAYCTQKTPYVFPIVGARKIDHIQGIIDGLGVSLSEEEVAEVERAYPFNHGFPHTFLSGTLFKGGDHEEHKTADSPATVSMTNSAGATYDWVEQPRAIRPPAKV